MQLNNDGFNKTGSQLTHEAFLHLMAFIYWRLFKFVKIKKTSDHRLIKQQMHFCYIVTIITTQTFESVIAWKVLIQKNMISGLFSGNFVSSLFTHISKHNQQKETDHLSIFHITEAIIFFQDTCSFAGSIKPVKQINAMVSDIKFCRQTKCLTRLTRSTIRNVAQTHSKFDYGNFFQGPRFN